MLTPELTVSQVLEAYPQAWRAFMALKTDCVSCYMMSFCSLREVAKQYRFSLEEILAAIARATSQSPLCAAG